MNNTKVYTAQEMREMAFKVQPAPNMQDREYKCRSKVEAMLRQAADTEEENAKLKARLAAVVKECEKRMKEYDCGACDFTDEPPWTFEQCEIKGCPTRLHAMEFLSILRAARGEGGAE